MKRCTILLVFLVTCHAVRLEPSNRDPNSDGSNIIDIVNGRRSKGEPNKDLLGKEGSETSKKQIRCDICDTCDPNPCVCYGKVPNCPKKDVNTVFKS